ncbi:hypothetical protein C7999DRAFT_31515 [Corynascus novoguineensis]|uniref:Uncharacterized protein n=1 Tax=Corynascus novoguineensis TaxID=1126955 RepID=A0AAN7CTF7_9PEZI|nr:hypothetical protein C7999DRAFT_31515 [Corynascus novoguineensis]
MVLATQFPDQHRKRFREEDEDVSSPCPVGFTEHRSKRLQSLPLRTSPNSKRWFDRPSFPQPNAFAAAHNAQTITPEEPIQQHMWADEPELVPAVAQHDNDMDMMMDMSDSVLGRDQTGFQIQPENEQDPSRADQSVPSVTGRIPTPIHCSFAAQVRGNNWNGGTAGHSDALPATLEEPDGATFGDNHMVDISTQKLTLAMATQSMEDWNMVQNRRLPSPISECGAEDSQGSSRMALDSPSSHAGHLNRLTHEHPLVAELPPRGSSAMEIRSGREGTPAMESQSGSAMDVETLVTPSPKKGHTRSKHTLNSWTGLQPGMTRSFSIGYRADCERCRNKVPGHFNHIIIS